jgi:hypothetical protein
VPNARRRRAIPTATPLVKEPARGDGNRRIAIAMRMSGSDGSPPSSRQCGPPTSGLTTSMIPAIEGRTSRDQCTFAPNGGSSLYCLRFEPILTAAARAPASSSDCRRVRRARTIGLVPRL